jgi:hypothetical protein
MKNTSNSKLNAVIKNVEAMNRWTPLDGSEVPLRGEAVRKRVGRPKSGKEAVWFWIRTETANLLREVLPSRERSAFVDDVIRRELEKTGAQGHKR